MTTTAKFQQGLTNSNGPGARRRSSFMAGSETNSKSTMILTSLNKQRDGASTGAGFRNYENSYKLEPEQKASSSRMETVVKATLEEHLTGRDYNADESPNLARIISEKIKQRAKLLGLPRYKFVCLVSIGPNDNTTMSMASQCVWNEKFDTYAEHVFRNGSMYAVAILYGVYFE